MSSTFDLLESKIHKVVEQLYTLRRENERLRNDCETLKAQLALGGGDNRKAQRILADYDQLRRNQQQATFRVERALQKLNALRA